MFDLEGLWVRVFLRHEGVGMRQAITTQPSSARLGHWKNGPLRLDAMAGEQARGTTSAGLIRLALNRSLFTLMPMARGRQPEPEPPVTGPARRIAIDRLREGLAAIPKWKETRDARPPEFENWKSRTSQSLGAAFGKGHDYYWKFTTLHFCVPRMVFPGGRNWVPEDVQAFDRDIAKAEALLTDALAEIDAIEGEGTLPAPPRPALQGNAVFIIHGHDEANLHRLRDLIEKRFKLHPVIMKWEAGKGRVMIEKFEQEAARCKYAFALLTPDDQIVATDGEYTQARPNVVFELGWFYGRLGRTNVAILLKKGTELHSDLDGISQITFVESVEEKFLDIERELQAAGLLST